MDGSFDSVTKQRGNMVQPADIRSRSSLQSRPGSRRGWLGAVIGATARGMISDRVSLAAAGCAFYATLALFPAIATLVFIYGLSLIHI